MDALALLSEEEDDDVEDEEEVFGSARVVPQNKYVFRGVAGSARR